jgi:hypothetical protein
MKLDLICPWTHTPQLILCRFWKQLFHYICCCLVQAWLFITTQKHTHGMNISERDREGQKQRGSSTCAILQTMWCPSIPHALMTGNRSISDTIATISALRPFIFLPFKTINITATILCSFSCIFKYKNRGPRKETTTQDGLVWTVWITKEIILMIVWQKYPCVCQLSSMTSS